MWRIKEKVRSWWATLRLTADRGIGRMGRIKTGRTVNDSPWLQKFELVGNAALLSTLLEDNLPGEFSE